jgi:nicotinate-nucleotide pyrophosphorylase (carboxylating)
MKEPHDFLAEDLGTGDVTTEALVGDLRTSAVILAKEDCVVAGIEAAAGIFRKEGLAVKAAVRDGARVKNRQAVMEISGPAAAILRTERLALNFIMRMSGIATLTRELVDLCREIKPGIRIAATRKTTPGLRRWEKDAVESGGGMRHREGLYDQFLIKDNHLKIVGSVSEAVKRARRHRPDLRVEVEVTDIKMAGEAAEAGADIIMLDNMRPAMARKAAARIRAINPRIIIEVSGGIGPKNILKYAAFADVISLGWLTHSVRAVDFSLEIID